jgi:hypothetical protein
MMAGRHEGLVQGKRDGLLEGEAKGRRDALRETLLRWIERRGLPLGGSTRAYIEAEGEVAVLERWIDRVAGARTVSDIFADDAR